jgi:thioredoxin-like negative regulator of GroEL
VKASSCSRRSTSTRTKHSPASTASAGFRPSRLSGTEVVSEFVGARPPAAVAQFLDELTEPSQAERLVAELRESGEAPEILAALDEDDPKRALELLLEETVRGDSERRERMRELALALFAEIGHEHPLTQRYRRRLATALY